MRKLADVDGNGDVDSGDGNNVDGDGYVEGDVDVDSVGDGDSDSACHWFFVESLRFLPGCAEAAGIHQTHDWKFDEADRSPSWDLPARTSFCCHFLHQSLKPCYIVMCMLCCVLLCVVGNNQIVRLFTKQASK